MSQTWGMDNQPFLKSHLEAILLFSKKITGVSGYVCVSLTSLQVFHSACMCRCSRGQQGVGVKRKSTNWQHSLIKIKGKQPNSLLFVAVRHLMQIS